MYVRNKCQSYTGSLMRKLNIHLLYYPTISLLGIYSREIKVYVQTETCTLMFTAAIMIAKKWKQLKCLSTG